MKKQTIYMIGNAHLDPAWVWSWQEGSCEAKATIRSVLDRMKEFPDFKFVCSSSSVYQWIEEFDGEMFAELKQRVAEGRFIVVGGWKVQPDCNLPNGENFARNSLYSQRYFFEKLGVTATVGYNVDSFGHNAMMPQILRRSGMKYYVYMRPMFYEKAMNQNIFTWESPDGSQVTAFRISETYCKQFNEMGELTAYLEDCSKFYGGDEFMGYYGVGNHGGGPTIRNIQLIEEYNRTGDGRFQLVMGDPAEFFEKFKKENTMAVVNDELQHHASGCYSAVSQVKTLLRKGETKLTAAEKYATLAKVLLKKDYDKKQIQNGWENLNFLTFHDILGGCCIKSAYENSLYMGYESISIAEKQKNGALQALSWRIDTTKKDYGLPIVVFNSHAFDVVEVVEINQKATAVYDWNGHEVAFENVVSEAQPVFDRENAIFKAKIPALGYAVYYYRPYANFNKVEFNKPAAAVKTPDPFTMENECLCVRFNERGNLTSVLNKRTGKEILQGETRSVVIDETEHDTWSHGRNHFNRVIGQFNVTSIEKLQSNSIREIVKVSSSYGASTLEQYYYLNVGEDMVRVKVKLNWNEKHTMLKLAFPVACVAPTSIYEIPFGSIERPCNGEEEPALMWAMVGDGENGLAILNDCKYSYSAKDNELCLTAIRSPIYCDHGLTRTTESNYTDQGIHEFEYAILPATTGERVKIFRRALALNTPAAFVMENHHEGTLPLQLCGATIDKENILISAIKKAECGEGYIVRAYECDGKDTTATLDCMGIGKVTARFGRYEVKTFHFYGDGCKEVLFTEFQE